METFSLILPSAALIPYVKYYWILRIDATALVTERTLPVGCVHLTFHRGSQLLSLTENQLQPRGFICGQTPSFLDVASTGSIDMINVVFQPHAPRLFFRIPMNEFHGMNVSVSDMADPDLADLEKQIADIPNDTDCIHLIEDFLLKRLRDDTAYNIQRMNAVIREINLQPLATTSTLAQVTCLSNKQFNRIFTEYIGATPKEFLRIIRMQRALYILQTQPGINFAQLAGECGYYDQSHLIKEFKLFSGYTPGEYLTICAPYSDYFSTF